ncbi:glutathione S-transferase [Paucibacter sp. Y2R2-4]|uniref:glutathione S-transferase n=1 Tax=Paucibacter sp. Y2R2-4 TaxID=2893553 RepID=UPI0021E4E437|nr:glutathione S-transferase [Paucibacter sp. Y2R2-4]MCV2349687.1 glutathione S-transferase [Paucibacter sp. Y2R2-4]
MSIALYGSRGSGSAAIEMALRACDLDYELIRASSWEPESRYQELLQVNPLGQIPSLRLADGTVLSESAAILIHLGLQYPQAGLLPSEPSLRAQHLRGLVYIAANCYAAVSVSDFPAQWTTSPEPAAHEAVKAAARAKLHQAWAVFADVFAPLLHESEPGALAFLAVVVSQWSGSRAYLKANKPEFFQSLLELEAQPRLAATLRQHRDA